MKENEKRNSPRITQINTNYKKVRVRPCSSVAKKVGG